MGGRKGQPTLPSDISEILKTLRLCVRRTRCWNFLDILNVTISSELLWPAAPPCPAGLVLVDSLLSLFRVGPPQARFFLAFCTRLACFLAVFQRKIDQNTTKIPKIFPPAAGRFPVIPPLFEKCHQQGGYNRRISLDVKVSNLF